MKPNCILLIACAALLSVFEARGAVDIIVPQGALEGDGNSNVSPLNSGQTRFQQVYDASIFAGYPQGVLIDTVEYRVDSLLGHGFDTTVFNVQIHLSTTSKAVDSLSPVFAENVGSDDRLVAGPAPFRLFNLGGGGVQGGWEALVDIRSVPFYYNPASGNLLLDIIAPNGAVTTAFDAVDMPGDSVSSVASYFVTPIPSSGQLSTIGMSTLFVFEPVPEPSTVSIFVLGIVAAGLAARRRMRRSN